MISWRNLAIVGLLTLSTVAEGQGRRGRRGGPPGDSSFNMGQARQAIERVIRNQVKPTDAQMKQLQAIDRKYEPQRIELNREELQTRQQLRRAMLDTANVNESRIGELLDKLVTFPGRRADILEAEQKDLSAVLSPLQRARYQAIQEQLRRRIEQGRGRPPGAPPPAR